MRGPPPRIGPRHLHGSLGRFTRGKSLFRLAHDAALIPILRELPPGDVLDVGSKDRRYESRLPRGARLKAMDVRPGEGIDYVCDAHDMKPIADGTFAAAMAIQVLEHCHTPQRVVDEIRRILRPGGTCVLSTPFVYAFHPDPQDFYRYTEEGLHHLFSAYTAVTVVPYGNTLQSAAQLLASRHPSLQILFPLLARMRSDRLSPLGYIAVARK